MKSGFQRFAIDQGYRHAGADGVLDLGDGVGMTHQGEDLLFGSIRFHTGAGT